MNKIIELETLLRASEQKALNTQTANKILTDMDNLRRKTSLANQRRWIWELIQNAKDVAFEDDGVNIQIEFTDDNLIFSHTGKPFTVDNITFLIEQVSSKDRFKEDDNTVKTTGKYGTGFLTTHLLSEKVTINGFINQPNIQCKGFEIELDRSGERVEQIIESVAKSKQALYDLNEDNNVENYNPLIHLTSFRYQLDEPGKKIVQLGLSDLQTSLPYVLAIQKQIKKVSIFTNGAETTYWVSKINHITDYFKTVDINIYHTKGKLQGPLGSVEPQNVISILRATKNDIDLLLPISVLDSDIYINKINVSTPRLFCDFPLIGTEDLKIPAIIQSSLFEVTEPRDGIWLTNPTRQDPKVDLNKKLFEEAILLYTELLKYGANSNWINLFNMAANEKPGVSDWLYEPWYIDRILKPIRKAILYTPIIVNESGEKKSIKNDEGKFNIYFPSNNNSQISERIWELCYPLFASQIPKRSDIHEWFDVIWSDLVVLDLKQISTFIQNKVNIDQLFSSFSSANLSVLEWLNDYYDILNLDAKFIKNIIDDNFKVIPNQQGVFQTRSKLMIDDEIEEALKVTCDILEIKLRESLRLQGIITESKYASNVQDQITHFPKTQEQVIKDINEKLSESNPKNGAVARNHLISLFVDDKSFPDKREKIYEFNKDILKSEIPEKQFIVKWSNAIWNQVDLPRIERLAKDVSKGKSLIGLKEIFNDKGEAEILQWLSNFLTFIETERYTHILNDSQSPIVPNQNGNFCILDKLNKCATDIDEEIKDIAESLGIPVRNNLIHDNTGLNLPENRYFSLEEVARLIEKEVKTIIKDPDSRLQHQNTLMKLYTWMKDHSKAESVFGNLYEKRMFLLDDEILVDSFKKANKYDEFKAKTGLTEENIDEYINDNSDNKIILFLDNDENTYSNYAEQGWTAFIEFCKSRGVNMFQSVLELVDLYGNNRLADIGVSTGVNIYTPLLSIHEIRDYAIEITLQAIKKVLEFFEREGFTVLENKMDYPNIFLVKDNQGKVFNVIIRPSHAGKYQIRSEELAVLREPNSELWLSNGADVKRETLPGMLQRIKDAGGKFIPLGPFMPGTPLA